MEKPAPTEHDVHELIRKRWSPRAFSSKPVSDGELRSLFEAARWAASCFNEQPWRFIVTRRENQAEFDRLLSCLSENNQRWAKGAAVLMLSVASQAFAKNAKPNRHALHDVGFAAAQLTLQATAFGLAVHQMAGFATRSERASFSRSPTSSSQSPPSPSATQVIRMSFPRTCASASLPQHRTADSHGRRCW